MYLKCIARLITDNEEIRIVETNIESSIESRTTTAKVTIPRFKRVQEETNYGVMKNYQIPIELSRGQKVRIVMYYTDEFDREYYRYERFFYITRTEIDRNKLNLYLEDEMFQLKGAETIITEHYLAPSAGGGSHGQSDLVQFLKDKVEELGYNVVVLPKNLKYETDEYEFVDMTLAQVLTYMNDNYLLRSFFIDDKTLIIGRIYEGQINLPNLETHTLSFLANTDNEQVIIDHDLTYYDDKNVNIEIEAKNYLRSNEVVTVKKFTGVGETQRKVDVVFYNLSSKAFNDNIEELIRQNRGQGFIGTFNTFGGIYTPYLKIGDIVKFSNILYSNRIDEIIEGDIAPDEYLIEGVTFKYTSSGIRQDVTIGKKIT